MNLLELVDTRDVDIRKETVSDCESKLEEMRGRRLTPEEKRKFRQIAKVQSDASGKCPVIDMVKLLHCSTPDGMPVWTVVNPYYRIGKGNGWFANRQTSYARAYFVRNNRWYNGSSLIYFGHTTHLPYTAYSNSWFRPDGNFPTLPDRIRELLWSTPIKRAYSVGLVYQPGQWVGQPKQKAAPDPALVVRWTSTDVWHCRAVWGHDGPRIQEFY
jgi:hypothetical protein